MSQPIPPSLAAIYTPLLHNLPGTYALAVTDLCCGKRWLINSQPMRSASLIKVFIMVEALYQSGQNLLNLEQKQAITATPKVGGAGLLQDAPPDTEKTWLELIELMITESDNMATNLLIDKLTMAAVNERIAALGCRSSVLHRKMMDFTSAAQGRENITTVEDMALVLEKIHHQRCLDTERDKVMLDILSRQQDRCKLPLLLPPGTPIAHKTGELEGAEHDAGIIFGPVSHYIIVVMADFLPDNSQGIETIAQLSRQVFDYLQTGTLSVN